MPASVFIHLQNHAQRRGDEYDVRIWHDVSKQTLTFNKILAPFSSFTLLQLLQKSPLLSSEMYSEFDVSKVNHICLSFMQIQ